MLPGLMGSLHFSSVGTGARLTVNEDNGYSLIVSIEIRVFSKLLTEFQQPPSSGVKNAPGLTRDELRNQTFLNSTTQ